MLQTATCCVQTCHASLPKALKMHSFYQPKTVCLFSSLMSFIPCLFAGGCWLAVSSDSPHLSSVYEGLGTAFRRDFQNMPPSCLHGRDSAKAFRNPMVLHHAV